MKNIFYLAFLFFTVSLFSQSQKELIEDNCNCVQEIDNNLDKGKKKKAIMECTLNAFKKNKSYTEKVVKEFTGKDNVEGKDIFLYHQDIFNFIMIDNCSEYRTMMSEILGTEAPNAIIEKLGDEICSNLPNDLSEEIIKSTIDEKTRENYPEISKTYTEEKGQQYISDLRDYLVSNCGKYIKYIEHKYKN